MLFPPDQDGTDDASDAACIVQRDTHIGPDRKHVTEEDSS